jgi:peptide/nickel transport system ATP-binding protein
MAGLRVDGLSVRIGGRDVLKSVSMSVAPGEVLGLVGESGSGKSMTLNAIMRLLPKGAAMTGAIGLDGCDLGAISEPEMCKVRGTRIGMVFQEPMTALNPLHPIGRQVAEAFQVQRGMARLEAVDAARIALERAGLGSSIVGADRYPHELSGGQRQRVVIAIATALKPGILLADEPTTALDVTTQAQILKLFRQRVDEDGMGLIFVSHDLAVVSALADRVAIMKDGEIVEEGRAPDVFRALKHPYSQNLLAATSHAPVRSRKPDRDGVPVIKAEGLVRTYPGRRGGEAVRAVDGISLEVFPGETVAVVGESGSGKSTLARMIVGLDPHDAGNIQIASKAMSIRDRRRDHFRTVQMVFQDPYGSFNPRMKVEDIVAEPLHLLASRPAPDERRRMVDGMLERVGLPAGSADRFPHAFSGGQRQRIAIARALILNPRAVVLDEAVSALDMTVRAQILDLLASLSDDLGLGYLFITHDLSLVRAIADRVLVMKSGKVVEEGDAARVFASPSHAYTRDLLAATPVMGDAPETARAP